jgi:hypothetical protein
LGSGSVFGFKMPTPSHNNFVNNLEILLEKYDLLIQSLEVFNS